MKHRWTQGVTQETQEILLGKNKLKLLDSSAFPDYFQTI